MGNKDSQEYGGIDYGYSVGDGEFNRQLESK